MRWLKSRILWGSLLLVFGILVLLENFGLFTLGGMVAAILLLLGGIFFIAIYAETRQHWWPLIPGITLLSVAAVVFVSQFFPRFADAWSGMIILAGIGVSFLVVYFLDRSQWWAIIPAGVMITLGVVAGLEDALQIDGGAIFFLGLALTFAILAVLPTTEGRMRWAWIPAGILFLMTFVVFSPTIAWFQYIWPAALIFFGGYLILRNLLSK